MRKVVRLVERRSRDVRLSRAEYWLLETVVECKYPLYVVGVASEEVDQFCLNKPSHGLPALVYDIESKGAQSYLALAQEVMARDASAAPARAKTSAT